MSSIEKTKELLIDKAELTAKLSLLAYSGTPDIKTNSGIKYIYLRKRELGKVVSTYVGPYTEQLFNEVARICKEHRALSKQIRQIDKELALLGYEDNEITNNVALNIEFAKTNIKNNIYSQAILEGITTTFPQTANVIDNGKVIGLKADDVQKILKLKHAWQFILDKDVIRSYSDYYLCTHIAKLVNEGFFEEGGKIRSVPVTIGGTSYIPPIPNEIDVKDTIRTLIESNKKAIDVAIELLLFVMKTQIFNDGNKRTAVIFANHYLIAHGQGLIVIEEKLVEEFKKELVLYYENKSNSVKEFLKKKCWKKIN